MAHWELVQKPPTHYWQIQGVTQTDIAVDFVRDSHFWILRQVSRTLVDVEFVSSANYLAVPVMRWVGSAVCRFLATE